MDSLDTLSIAVNPRELEQRMCISDIHLPTGMHCIWSYCLCSRHFRLSRSSAVASKSHINWIVLFDVSFFQINHFPGTFQLGRKDRLWHNLSKMFSRFGKKEFGFFPQTFILPADRANLKIVFDNGKGKQKWIIKPVSVEFLILSLLLLYLRSLLYSALTL